MASATFDDEAPTGAAVSGYDIAHVTLYIRLLDAEAAGLGWRAIAARLFAIDAAREPERARRVVESHAARARWMRDEGYKGLLGRPPPS